MRKGLLIAVAALVLGSACTSVERVSVASNEIVANGGEAMGVIQVSVVGLTAIFHIIDIAPADLDMAINKVLVSQAKDMGASKVQLVSVSATPRNGIFALWGTLVGFPTATVVGIAVK